MADEGIHVVIIGAGLAGLAAALSTKLANPSHRVTICETVRELQEVGAGLQVTPNGTLLLDRWGLSSTLQPLAAIPTTLSVHRYDGTKLLAHEPALQDKVVTRYGHPFWDIHRVDLQKAMVTRCRDLGVEILLDARAVSVDFGSSSVRLASGLTIKGDAVLLADGLWSSIRPAFVGKPSPAVLTGDLAFRITLRLDELDGPDADELASLIQKNPTVRFWIGPNAHAVGYSVRAGSMYNLVLLCPDDLPESVVKQEGSLEEMRARFEGWDPLLHRLLGQVKIPVHKWKLMWLEPLDRWADGAGTFYMAGDCCHPMLPYLAQGANSSLEDGAVLGHLLGKVSGNKKGAQLPRVAEMYQRLRMPRGRRIQLETFAQRDDSHLEDGPRQEERDRVFERALETGEPTAPFPSRWTCPEIQRFLWGYDAYEEAERAFRESPF
ncbi:hypothetical protein QBC47DRAFT_384743 [Echria macrotheca]|uniref:FAD-binding domain-containing protein n=1 Tax=Echria macrotheca TaxID=438768 RepID=A0AAJ0FB13_9PEZI|nr:hypothetical protein QBC47DRAFT_384743 [Echria macrotheca]